MKREFDCLNCPVCDGVCEGCEMNRVNSFLGLDCDVCEDCVVREDQGDSDE